MKNLLKKQHTEEDEIDEIEPFTEDLELLKTFVQLIKRKFCPATEFDPLSTIIMTTEELKEKVILASGNSYSTNNINTIMNDFGFEMQFIKVTEPNYYWLMNPIN